LGTDDHNNHNRIRSIRGKISEITPDRWAELGIALAVVIFAALQYRSSQSITGQTDQLIAAAKVSAYAATQNVQASTNFAESARSINSGIGDAVDRLNRQATQTTNLATSTKALAAWSEQSARVELALNRPLITVQNPAIRTNPPNPSQPRQLVGYLALSLQNSGRLTAQDVQYKLINGTYTYSLRELPGALARSVQTKIDSALSNSKLEWTKIGDVPFGSPSDHIIPVNIYADPEGPLYFLAGRVEYGGPLEETEWVEFCFQVETTVNSFNRSAAPITLEPSAFVVRCPIGQRSGTYPKENKDQQRHK
jgi:hypothetical protein